MLVMDYSDNLQTLFNKYLNGNCTPGEVRDLIALLQQARAEDELSEPMQALWESFKNAEKEYPVDWEKMYLSVTHRKEDFLTLNRYRIGSRSRWYQVAAIVLVMVISAVTVYWYHIKNAADDKKSYVKTQLPPSPRDRQIIHLPDGSTVILNANSKLDYPSAFNGKTREVYLSGEAYFDIKHHSLQPFLVHTGNITTKVLGTAFDIKAYPGDIAIDVTVTRGRVQVLKGNKSLGLITVNQQIAYSKITEAAEKRVVDTRPVIAWKPEDIIFNDITMAEAVKKIESKFNVTIEFVNPAIKNCRVSATFSEEDVLDEMLTVLCAVSKAGYTFQNNKILIDGKGCN